MPCNGIAVMNAITDQQEEILDEIRKLMVGKEQRTRGVIKLNIVVPMAGGGVMPVKVAIEKNGKITAITQKGTFEVGVDVLKKWIASLNAKGVKLDVNSFEPHHHDHHAPQLAYTAKAVQR